MLPKSSSELWNNCNIIFEQGFDLQPPFLNNVKKIALFVRGASLINGWCQPLLHVTQTGCNYGLFCNLPEIIQFSIKTVFIALFFGWNYKAVWINHIVAEYITIIRNYFLCWMFRNLWKRVSGALVRKVAWKIHHALLRNYDHRGVLAIVDHGRKHNLWQNWRFVPQCWISVSS